MSKHGIPDKGSKLLKIVLLTKRNKEECFLALQELGDNHSEPTMTAIFPEIMLRDLGYPKAGDWIRFYWDIPNKTYEYERVYRGTLNET